MRAKSVSDLARAVDRRLQRDRIASLGVHKLRALFEVVYFASLKTEEGKPLQVRVALIDPTNPDPEKPPVRMLSRWTITRLSPQLPLTVANLTKLCKAADPWSSCLAVYHNSSDGFFI